MKVNLAWSTSGVSMLSAPQHQDAMKMAHVIRTLAQIAFIQGEDTRCLWFHLAGIVGVIANRLSDTCSVSSARR